MPQVLATQFPKRLPLLQTPAFGGARAICTSDKMATNSGVPKIPSDFIISLEQLMELGKTQLYYEVYKSGPAKQVQVWGIRKSSKLLCPLRRESRHVTLPEYQCVYQSRNSAELQCPELLLGLHYVGTADCITGHRTDLSAVLLPSLEIREPSSHTAGLPG